MLAMTIMTGNSYFKVGGSLRYGHPSYIIRKADRDIYHALREKEFCYVLNSRQMGKSSLRVRTMKILAQEGFKCVVIDLGILSRFAETEQWFGGLVAELWRKLRLTTGINDDLEWWRSHEDLPPVLRFSRFIADVLLVNCDKNIVIFLDEVDNIISLYFRDELLVLIRNCYEKRAESPQYSRLTFCLLGVATPSNLRLNKHLNPLNIGKAIQLRGFNLQEAQPLVVGLANNFAEPETILKEILDWTKGQPFLTQKICALAVRHQEIGNNITQLIQYHLIDNWEINDEPEHLKTIRDRLLHNAKDKARLLTLYRYILQHQGIDIDGSDKQVELRLSGLVTAQQGKLKVSNPIYEKVFNRQWVDRQLAAISPYQDAIAIWLKSNRRDDSRLLRGKALEEGQKWAMEYNITAEEKEFLHKSEFLAKRAKKQAGLAEKTEIAERRLVQEKRLVRWQRLFIAFSIVMLGGFYLKSRQTNLSNINTLVQSSEALFASEQKLDSLIAAIKAKRQLNKSWLVNQNTSQRVDAALQESVYEVQEYNRLLGHSDKVYSVAVANNGKLMATAATDNTVRLWRNDNQGWQPDKILKHNGWVVDVAINQISSTPQNLQGVIIASASRDRTVKVWHQNGELIHTLKHAQSVSSVAIKPNGQIVTGSEDGTIKIWQGDKIIQTLTGHTAAVESIAIKPNDQIVTGSQDGTIKIWQEDKIIQTLTGHTGGVRGVAVNQDGTKIVSASTDKTLKIWDSNGEIATLRGHSAPVYSVAINLHNGQIVSASADKTLKVWDNKGNEITTLKGHINRVWDVAYFPNNNIASVSWDKTIRLWQPDNDLMQVLSGHKDVAIALDYSDNILASTSDDRTVKLWNEVGILKTFKEHTAEVYDVAISPIPPTPLKKGGAIVASVGADRSLRIWQTNGKVINTIKPAHKAPIWAVDISPDGNKIATAGDDSLIKIWQIDGNLLQTLKGHTQKVWDVAIAPQGAQIASASEDNTIKIWQIDGNLLQTLEGHQDAVRTVAYSSDGSFIVSGSEDRTVKIWQPDQPNKLLTTLVGHQAAVKAVTIDSSDRYIASVDDDGKIILWHKVDRVWKQRHIWTGQNNSLWSAIFTSDRKIVTAGEDYRLVVWNLDRILQLDFLKYACSWTENYLRHSTKVDSSDRKLCNSNGYSRFN